MVQRKKSHWRRPVEPRQHWTKRREEEERFQTPKTVSPSTETVTPSTSTIQVSEPREPKHERRSNTRKQWALDLFSGTGSVSRTEGNWVLRSERRLGSKWHADVVVDVRKWKYWEQSSPGDFELVAASPPCTEYSSAMTIRDRQLKEADSVQGKSSVTSRQRSGGLRILAMDCCDNAQ